MVELTKLMKFVDTPQFSLDKSQLHNPKITKYVWCETLKNKTKVNQVLKKCSNKIKPKNLQTDFGNSSF